MLRSSRSIASLIHALLLGSVATVGLGAIATTVVGCKDESQPEYWLDKLEDPAWRPRAVKRLEQFFEDAITRANKDMEAPEVKKLADQIVEPLTKAYVEKYDEFDTKTRVSMIKLLAATRDPRAVPALKKAFEEFAKSPKTTKDEADIKWASRAVKEMKPKEVAGPMIETFQKLKTHTMLGGIVYRDLNEAMLAMADPSWAGPLTQLLGSEIDRPEKADDTEGVEAFRDQLFWQTTSAQILGEIGDASAVEPLLKVLLDPGKVDVHVTAILALVKIGKPAVAETVKLLNGELKDLVAYHIARTKAVTKSDKAPEDEPHVRVAALVLGTIGRPEAIAPMIAALKSTKHDVNKAVIARELTKIPATSESKAAFKETFESLSAEAVVPPGSNAKQMLAEAAGRFYDADMIDWLMAQAEGAKGYAEDRRALQSIITVTMIKLAKADQLPTIKRAVDKFGTQLEKDIFAQVEKQLKACGDRVQCYLAEIEKSENQDQKTQFGGIKAGTMIAVLGDESARGELIKRFDAIDNAAVRYVAAQAVDHLSPKGSKEAADELEAIIEKNVKSADRNKIQGDQPLKEVMYRIRSRAE